MALVKCQYCSRKTDKAKAKKVPYGKNRNKYYHNSCYREYEIEQLKLKKIISYLLDIFIFVEEQDVKKSASGWIKEYGFEKLNTYFYDNFEYLQNVYDRKTFTNVYGMCAYMNAIIKNNINSVIARDIGYTDEYVPLVESEKEIEYTDKTKYRRKKKKHKGIENKTFDILKQIGESNEC